MPAGRDEPTARKVLVLASSPRRDGNSARLAEAAAEGARAAGHDTALEHLDDHVRHFLRDCRRCRDVHGRCTIDDGMEALLRERVLEADGIVFATPVYWYGVSGQLKTFFDRLFCFIAASEPDAELFVAGLTHKRLGLVVSSEETYPGAVLALVHEIQEYARYTHSDWSPSYAGSATSAATCSATRQTRSPPRMTSGARCSSARRPTTGSTPSAPGPRGPRSASRCSGGVWQSRPVTDARSRPAGRRGG